MINVSTRLSSKETLPHSVWESFCVHSPAQNGEKRFSGKNRSRTIPNRTIIAPPKPSLDVSQFVGTPPFCLGFLPLNRFSGLADRQNDCARTERLLFWLRFWQLNDCGLRPSISEKISWLPRVSAGDSSWATSSGNWSLKTTTIWPKKMMNMNRTMDQKTVNVQVRTFNSF